MSSFLRCTMILSSRPIVCIWALPPPWSPDSIKFPHFLLPLCLSQRAEGLGRDRGRKHRVCESKNVYLGTCCSLHDCISLLSLRSDVSCPTNANSLAHKVSFYINFILFCSLSFHLFSSQWSFFPTFFPPLHFCPCLLITFLLLKSAEESHSGTMKL